MELGARFAGNPILKPSDIAPLAPGYEVACALNPGVFEWQGRIHLAVRVAERPKPAEGFVDAVMLDPSAPGGVRHVRYDRKDPSINATDPRVLYRDGVMYLTTVSHLRFYESDDGERFRPSAIPPIAGEGPLESFGIEDVRVTALEGEFVLAYTAVSEAGCGVGMIRTRDWRTLARCGMVLPPPNKDCAVFPERIGGSCRCLHRPSAAGNHIWLARSPDLVSWAGHRPVILCRPGRWDSARIGVSGVPVRVPGGWLVIYHGADGSGRYCQGACLLDAADPARVLARTEEPIMEPTAQYERQGFFGNVVFSNGHVVRGDELFLYYGASDEVVCGARMPVAAILKRLQ